MFCQLSQLTRSIIEDDTLKCVTIPSDNFYVMRVNGIDIGDNEFKLISKTEFNEIVNNYIAEFQLTPEEITINSKSFKLEHLNVDELSYDFDSDLCSFTLYNIYRMSFEKPSLYNTFKNTGDIRVILDLINKYDYTDEEASMVINIYEPYENDYIPEVEHIEVLLMYFPTSEVSHNTMNAIKNTFPDRVNPILELQSKRLNP